MERRSFCTHSAACEREKCRYGFAKNLVILSLWKIITCLLAVLLDCKHLTKVYKLAIKF